MPGELDEQSADKADESQQNGRNRMDLVDQIVLRRFTHGRR